MATIDCSCQFFIVLKISHWPQPYHAIITNTKLHIVHTCENGRCIHFIKKYKNVRHFLTQGVVCYWSYKQRTAESICSCPCVSKGWVSRLGIHIVCFKLVKLNSIQQIWIRWCQNNYYKYFFLWISSLMIANQYET